jgi:hypothetical protein
MEHPVIHQQDSVPVQLAGWDKVATDHVPRDGSEPIVNSAATATTVPNAMLQLDSASVLLAGQETAVLTNAWKVHLVLDAVISADVTTAQRVIT